MSSSSGGGAGGGNGPSADLDEQIKEYLLYRGFTSAARAFESEINKSILATGGGAGIGSGLSGLGPSLSASSGAVDKACNVDKIVETIMNLIVIHDLQQLTSTWNFISKKFFCSLDSAQSSALRKIELSMFRCYLVNCVTSGRSEKVLEFFEKSPKLLPQYDWGEWYGLPYVRNPELNDRFAPFFQRAWQETFTVSLHNFLNVIFFTSAKPSLLNHRQEAALLQNFKDENVSLKNQLLSSQNQISTFKDHILSTSTTIEEATTPTPIATVGKAPSQGRVAEDFLSKEALPQHANVSNQERPPSVNSIGGGANSKTATNGAFVKSSQPSSKAFISTGLKQTIKLALPKNTRNSRNLLKKQDTQPCLQTSISVTGDFNDGEREKDKAGLLSSKSIDILNGTRSSNVSLHNNSSNFSQGMTGGIIFTASSLPSPPGGNSSGDVNYTNASNTDSSSGSHASKSTTTNRKNSFTSSPKSFFSTFRSPNSHISSSSASDTYLMLSKDSFHEHSSVVNQCRFSSSGNYIASSDSAGIVKVWSSVKTASTVATIMSKSTVTAIEWVASKDDNLLLIANDKSTIRLYDVANKRSISEFETPSVYPSILSLATSPNGCRLVSSQSSVSQTLGSVTCWDMKTLRIERQLEVADGNVKALCVDFNHNGALVVLGCCDGTVRVFDVQTSDQLTSWNVSNVKSVHVMPINVKFNFDESAVYTMCSNGIFVMWSLRKLGMKQFEFALSQKSINFQTISSAAPGGSYPRLFATDSQDCKFLVPAENGVQVLVKNDVSSDIKVCQKIATSPKAASCLDWTVATSTLAIVNGATSNNLVICHLLEK